MSKDIPPITNVSEGAKKTFAYEFFFYRSLSFAHKVFVPYFCDYMVSTFEFNSVFLLLLIGFETDVHVFHPDVGTVHKENGNKFAQVVQSVVGLDPITLSNML